MIGPLLTERLQLRELTPADAPFIRRLLNEPSFLRFIGDRGVRNDADAANYLLRGPMASYSRHGHGLLRVGLRADDTPVGICGLVRRDTLPQPDIGFAFLPEHWSQGFAFEAAEAALRHGRDMLGLEEVLAIVTPGNERSVALLARLGLRFEREVSLGGDPKPLLLFRSAAAT